MLKIVQHALASQIALGALLGAAAALILWTDRLDGIASPTLHVLAIVAELACGVPILLGALYISTQSAVRIFARGAEPNDASPARAK
jgi:hypothetical protein